MDTEQDRDDSGQARDEDPGSSEAPVSGQPGGGLDDDAPETEDSPVGAPEKAEDDSAEQSTDDDDTHASGI